MSYKIVATGRFKSDIKKLAKKYPTVKREYIELVKLLEIKPEQGVSLGGHCYKIRFAIESKGKGKSGGARVITHIIISDEQVFLLTIYDKSEKENVTAKELKELLSQISE